MTSQTDTEVVAHLLGRRVAAGRAAGRGDAYGRPAAAGGLHSGRRGCARSPRSVVAARRNSPLVVGVGEGENFVASDVAAFIEHTREAIELGQDQVVLITRDAVVVTTFDGTPAEVRPYHVDWDLSAAEKGGLRLVHAQGDLRAAEGGRRHPARPARRQRPADPGRDPDLRGRAAAGRQDRGRGLRHRVLRRSGGQVRDRALDPDPVRGGAGQRVPLPRPDRRPDHAGRGHQPVR